MRAIKPLTAKVQDKMANLPATFQNAKGSISGWAKGLRACLKRYNYGA